MCNVHLQFTMSIFVQLFSVHNQCLLVYIDWALIGVFFPHYSMYMLLRKTY